MSAIQGQQSQYITDVAGWPLVSRGEKVHRLALGGGRVDSGGMIDPLEEVLEAAKRVGEAPPGRRLRRWIGFVLVVVVVVGFAF
jgi:hypothetical protein